MTLSDKTGDSSAQVFVAVVVEQSDQGLFAIPFCIITIYGDPVFTLFIAFCKFCEQILLSTNDLAETFGLGYNLCQKFIHRKK